MFGQKPHPFGICSKLKTQISIAPSEIAAAGWNEKASLTAYADVLRAFLPLTHIAFDFHKIKEKGEEKPLNFSMAAKSVTSAAVVSSWWRKRITQQRHPQFAASAPPSMQGCHWGSMRPGNHSHKQNKSCRANERKRRILGHKFASKDLCRISVFVRLRAKRLPCSLKCRSVKGNKNKS